MPSAIPSFLIRCRRDLRVALDRLVDYRLQIDTLEGTEAFPEKTGRFEDATRNIPLSYYLLFRFLGPTTFKRTDVFYDIGCGTGRVLCYMARRQVSKVTGIELSPTFANKARLNAKRLRGRISTIEVRCGDAAEMDYRDGTVFFLYNPFGAETLKLVLDKIQRSLTTYDRSVSFMYQNPVHSIVMRSSGWLKYAGQKEDPFVKHHMELWTYERS